MHYRINNILVESDLAAKPTCQINKKMIEIIDNLPKDISVLDYGCGKLRYSIPLSKHVHDVVAIDSSFQVDKKQKRAGLCISPRDYNCKNLLVDSIESMTWANRKYDVVFCVNVLSAIPFDLEREIVIQNAKNVLKPNGYMLLVVQYRNSYFTGYRSRDDTIRFNDGWLIKRKNNKYAFYGMPSEEKVINMCKDVGFKSFHIMRYDGTYYIKAYLEIAEEGANQ